VIRWQAKQRRAAQRVERRDRRAAIARGSEIINSATSQTRLHDASAAAVEYGLGATQGGAGGDDGGDGDDDDGDDDEADEEEDSEAALIEAEAAVAAVADFEDESWDGDEVGGSSCARKC
jgi:hypothetical protein